MRTAILSILIGVGGILFGVAQKRLRKAVISRLSPYQQKYEELIDKNRTSSNINTDGSTKQEDM